MEKKKVYVVIIDEVIDRDKVGSIDVFETKEKAQAKYDSFVEKTKKWIEDNERVDWDTEESTNAFEAWECGYYVENHSCANIYEKEIQ